MKLQTDIIALAVLGVVGFIIWRHAPIHNIIGDMEAPESGDMGDEVHPAVWELGSGGPPNRRNDKSVHVQGEQIKPVTPEYAY